MIGDEQGRFSRFEAAPSGPVQVDQLYDKDFNNFGPRVSAIYDLGGDGKTVLRAGWGIFYDAFSQDFFVGQIPWDTFNPGSAYNEIVTFSFSPVRARPGSAGLHRLRASDVLDGGPEPEDPVDPELQRERAAAAGTPRRPSRSATSAPRARTSSASGPSTRPTPPPGAGPIPTSSTCNQFESTATSTYNALAGEPPDHRLARPHLDGQLHVVALHRHASDGQDYVPHAAQPDDSLAPRARARELRTSTRGTA